MSFKSLRNISILLRVILIPLSFTCRIHSLKSSENRCSSKTEHKFHFTNWMQCALLPYDSISPLRYQQNQCQSKRKSREIVQLAIACVQLERVSIREAARRFNMSKSALHHHIAMFEAENARKYPENAQKSNQNFQTNHEQAHLAGEQMFQANNSISSVIMQSDIWNMQPRFVNNHVLESLPNNS